LFCFGFVRFLFILSEHQVVDRPEWMIDRASEAKLFGNLLRMDKKKRRAEE
jgi:hypothetical protein